MTESLVVVQKNDHSLGIYDLRSGAEAARIALDPYPHEFVLTRDRRYALQSHFGVALAEDIGAGGSRISVVDLQRREVAGYLDCAPWRRPHGIAADGNDRLFVLSEAADRLLVAQGPRATAFDYSRPTGGAGSHMVTVNRAGTVALCSNMTSNDVSILDLADGDSEPRVVETGSRPEGSVLDASERLLYVACREAAEVTVVDVAAARVVDRIATPPGPVRLCWCRDGRLAAAFYHAQAVGAIDVRHGVVEDIVALPDNPVSIGNDGTSGIVMSSTLGDEVCLVDLARGELVRRIATRPGPDPVAVADL